MFTAAPVPSENDVSGPNKMSNIDRSEKTMKTSVGFSWIIKVG